MHLLHLITDARGMRTIVYLAVQCSAVQCSAGGGRGGADQGATGVPAFVFSGRM